MLRSILVGLDGSPDSNAAFELGLRWASRLDALLVGIGVVDEPGVHGVEEVLVGQAYFQRLNEELLTENRTKLSQVLADCRQKAEVAGVSFKPLEEVGDPCERITEAAQRVDLLIVGHRTHFRFGCEPDEEDDTLHSLLRTSPRPVVVAPATVPDGQSVVVAYDGRQPSARALYALVASGLAKDRPVHIISLSPDGEASSRAATRAVDYLALHGIESKAHAILTDESPVTPILEEMREWDPGLLVMGAHGRSAFTEFFLGSTTTGIIASSPIPVFLYH